MTTRPLRADARRNIDAILEAATATLARDPDASVNDIARAAGVGRVTLYGHFENRAALVSAVVERAMADVDAVLQALDLSGDPAAALVRLVDATWAVTLRYGALVVAAERSLPAAEVAAAHGAPRERAQWLIDRGRAEGRFRTDLPASWLVTSLHTVTHAAANSVYDGELATDAAAHAIAATMLGLLTPPGEVVPDVAALTAH
ncbi:TetR/AcrR family transcriptional regulator [Nocardioides albidus]|uniref:TetR/AcrR family transcriptional regulator n=1 Tax=Nocardioides albidus TaxID=1517589 RepID=A0A5C4VKQ2_9ACTN|nr:TetR/AcrR family transcriptional regulator [Nocardioides albidus]TNM36275.1 TetR/AcrR family transcriptional regulator [Nocardioides albidus]